MEMATKTNIDNLQNQITEGLVGGGQVKVPTWTTQFSTAASGGAPPYNNTWKWDVNLSTVTGGVYKVAIFWQGTVYFYGTLIARHGSFTYTEEYAYSGDVYKSLSVQGGRLTFIHGGNQESVGYGMLKLWKIF